MHRRRRFYKQQQQQQQLMRSQRHRTCLYIPIGCVLVMATHWLPVRRRVEFKITPLVLKALNGLAPPYLVDDCNLVSDDIR